MDRLIIVNKTDKSILDWWSFIEAVLAQGRISNNNTQYCYLTVFDLQNGLELCISSDLNKNSDKLTLWTKTV